jgi:hypothetical protein
VSVTLFADVVLTLPIFCLHSLLKDDEEGELLSCWHCGPLKQFPLSSVNHPKFCELSMSGSGRRWLRGQSKIAQVEVEDIEAR